MEETKMNMMRTYLKLFKRCKVKGIKLNKEKLEKNKDYIVFMGHCITKDGLKIDEEKIKAISKLQEPNNLTIVMTNYLGRFILN